MKNITKLLAMLICALLVSLCFASCGQEQNSDEPTPTAVDTPTAQPTEAATPTEAVTPFPTGKDGSDESYDAVAALLKVSSSDKLTVSEKLGWWDWFCRYTPNGDAMDVFDVNADAGGSGAMDEGRGPFCREDTYQGVKNNLELYETLNLKSNAWIECQGDSRSFLIALHQLEDGTFEMNEKTGAAKIIANPWTWTTNGPSKNNNANYLCWVGVHSFVNDEQWAAPFILSNYPELSAPTYPDGTVAKGYFDDSNDPAKSIFYDACAAKDLNGDIRRYEELFTQGSADTTGFVEYEDLYGKKYVTCDWSVGKDACAPFWLEYTKFTTKYWIERGVDWFWVDNWNGWDNFKNRPIERAFGDWTEKAFTEYLMENPQIGVTVTEDFNICDYIREKALELDPNTDVTDIRYQNSVWARTEWIEDPIWKAFLSFKAKVNREYNTNYYKGIKEAAKELGLNPDDICVAANDFPYLTYGAYDADFLDIVHTEYNCSYSAVTGFTTSGYPPNGYSGHAMNLMANMSKGTNAVLWYYTEDYKSNPNLAYVLSYEALAYNCTIYAGNATENITGTDRTAAKVNQSIGLLRDYFTDRKIYAEIGVVFSVDSEMSTLAPGGFVYGEKNPANVAYGGWCHAFDELNIPYRSISSARLAQQAELCNVLILPQVRSISKAEVNDILVPFLDRGGLLVITGEEAGVVDSQENNYMAHSSAILKDLADTYSGNGKVVYMETDIAEEYFTFHQKADMETLYELYLNEINSMVEGWYEQGYANKLVSFENLPDSVATTLNYAPYNNHLFVDIVNMQLDVDTDTVTDIEAGVKVKVRLPSSLWGKRLNVKLFVNGSKEIVDLYPDTDFVVENGMVEITLPAFNIYSSIIIREFQ
ncbi:MAG: hypothetical protein E7491_05275 [Ruminococcaceae bacterium]|nr:hypothetical protein [Oscillospiraceae bacterium]